MEFVETVIVVFIYVLAWLIILSAAKSGKSTRGHYKKKLRNIDDYVNEFGEGIIEYKEK